MQAHLGDAFSMPSPLIGQSVLGAVAGQSFRRWSDGDLRRAGGFRMYCAKCHRQLYYSDPKKHGWCFNCNGVVDIETCKVPFWSLMAVFTTAWPLCL